MAAPTSLSEGVVPRIVTLLIFRTRFLWISLW